MRVHDLKAEYVDHMGDDLRVVNSARVSFSKESQWDWESDENGFHIDPVLTAKDEKLVNYLASHNHFTPFAHPQITLREEVPIFVARQRFKHVVGFIYNEESRRYVDNDPEFFKPKEWRARAENKKQGSEGLVLNQEHCNEELGLAHRTCFMVYKELLKEGVAPEQARMVLPQSMYTSYYVTGSLAAWARAYKLRTDPHAQLEIRELAKEWDKIIRPLFPVSWKALVD